MKFIFQHEHGERDLQLVHEKIDLPTFLASQRNSENIFFEIEFSGQFCFILCRFYGTFDDTEVLSAMHK